MRVFSGGTRNAHTWKTVLKNLSDLLKQPEIKEDQFQELNSQVCRWLRQAWISALARYCAVFHEWMRDPENFTRRGQNTQLIELLRRECLEPLTHILPELSSMDPEQLHRDVHSTLVAFVEYCRDQPANLREKQMPPDEAEIELVEKHERSDRTAMTG